MKKRLLVFLTVVLIVITLFLYTESRPPFVISSMVYQTSDEVEIQMNVIINTFFGVKEETVAEEIIAKHKEINGFTKTTQYTLSLYRTLFHYRRNWEYDMLICDRNGAIICCEEDLKVK